MISAKLLHSTIRCRPALARRSMLLCIAFLALFASPAMSTDLTGVVLGANGKPAANVAVKLSTGEMMSISPILLSEATTDCEGYFRVTVPNRWFEVIEPWRGMLSLTVQTQDRGNGGIVISADRPLPRHRMTIQLERWTKRKISIQSADKKSLAGVRVKLFGLQLPIIDPPQYPSTPTRYMTAIPAGLLQSAGTTDESGTVELLLPPIESVALMEAEIEKNVFVIWKGDSNDASTPKNWSESLQVPKFRRIPVEMTFNDGGNSDLNLSVTSVPVNKGVTAWMRHAVELNLEGKASAVILNEAMLYSRNRSDKATEKYLSQNGWVDPTTLKRMSLSFGKGVKVTGRAVSSDGNPAANIRLFTIISVGVMYITTDAKGRFEFSVPAGRRALIPTGRSGYRLVNRGPQSTIVIPKATAAHDLGDIIFVRLKSLKGVVRDEVGKTVSGAIVTAIWQEPHPQIPRAMINRNEEIETNDEGVFVIPGLDPAAEPILVARHGSAVTKKMHSFSLEKQDKPASLTISRSHAISLSGRVLDQSGKGISGLEVTLRHRLKPPISEAQLPQGAEVEGLRMITDKNGSYATPKRLSPFGEYIVLIRAGTKREAISGWKLAKSGQSLVLPLIEDSQTLEFSGHILTADGKPLPKARIVVLTSQGQEETLSNADGTFTIDRPAGRMALLIAEAEGFLSNGVPIKAGQTTLEIRLPRTDQLPLKSQNANQANSPQPARWTRKRKQKLAVKLADGFENPDPQIKSRVDSAIARYLPDRILKRLDSLPPTNQMTGLMIRSSLAMGLAEDRPEEGLRLFDSFPDSPMKMHMLGQFERAAKLKDDDRMQLLARIVQDARGLTQADHRVAILGMAGERLLDLGQWESGEALLRETLNDAKQLSPAAFSGYARGVFSERLAQVDADAAFELLEPLTDTSEFNRHLQNIAHELAPIDPDLAIALLDKMREPGEGRRPLADLRESAALRVCYRMIRVAPDKAIQLARSIEHMALGPYSFGLMAESLLVQDEVSDADRKLARRLHDEAWEMLAKVRQEEDLSEVGYLYPSTIAGILLQQTAKLAPQQLSHRIWQTIALRRPMEKGGAYQFAGMGCASELAILLAEVDQNRAREVASWAPSPSSGSSQFASYVQFARPAAELIAELYPDQCESALEAITDSGANQRLRLALVKALLRTGDSRSRAIRQHMALWFPDDEDLGPIE